MMSQQPEQTQPEEPSDYCYYSIGKANPIRVPLDRKGRKMGAEYLDLDTGQLRKDATLLSRIEQSWEAEEIDKDRFDLLCKLLMQRKNHQPKLTGFS